MGLSVLTDKKGKSYDLILIIVDRFIKMVHYKSVKIMINVPGFAEVIINVIIWHYGLPDSIIIDRDSSFTSKFWSLLYYFLKIKKKLSMAFHPQIDGQIERQNSIIEAYFKVFVN